MKKETLLEIILGTIGGLIFAVGMCMCLIPEWNTFKAGVAVAITGSTVLLGIICFVLFLYIVRIIRERSMHL